jgi:hypothetical protein
MHDGLMITVVTPSFQQGRYLEATIKSVVGQRHVDLEYMIVDGGSTDGSVEIIRRYVDRLAYWASGPDGGQAEAINKGFALGHGDLLTWINSDDLLLPGSLEVAAAAHADHPQAILLGDVVHFSDEEALAFAVRQQNVNLDNMVAYWRPGWTWNQPGTFIPRSVWDHIGQLDESLRYTFDREWMCRALTAGVPIVYLGQLVAAFRMQPSSKTMGETTKWGGEQWSVTQRFAVNLPLSARDMAAEAQLLEATFRLSLLYWPWWNAAVARHYLGDALRFRPKLLLRRKYWALWIRALAPKKLVDGIRPVWLQSRRSAELLAMVKAA